MDSHQYTDLPQIHVGDDSPLNGWPDEYAARANHSHHPRTVNVFGEEVLLDDYHHQNMSSMQRYLSGQERPFTHGFLHSRHNEIYDSNLPFAGQHPIRAAPFPANDVEFPRDPSPETASSYTSYAPQNELHSSRMLEQPRYGSPSDYPQARLPYTPEPRSGGAYSEAPLTGGSIDPRAIEYEHDEPAPTVEEGADNNVEMSGYDQETSYIKMDVGGPDGYHTDSAIGQSLRDPESVHPVSPGAESDDSDYKPSGPTKQKKRNPQSGNGANGRQRKGGHSRRNSKSSATPSNRVRKASPSKTSINNPRPFPCPLAMYGCSSTFSSKNEWKRHVSTQHIKMGFWRCDLCPTTVDPHDPLSIYHNDFNRKDLFTQHLRRMHAAPTNQTISTSKLQDYPINDDNIAEHQTRCYQSLRSPPPQSSCLFCDRTFAGPGSWDERMEHVGRHLEKDRKNGGSPVDTKTWQEDEILREWLLNESLLEIDGNGTTRLGNGPSSRRARDLDV